MHRSAAPHALASDAVAAELDTDLRRGLTAVEADARLAIVGPNALARPQSPAYVRLALRQVLDPLVGLLIAAAVVSAAIGETVEAAAIGLIVVLNGAFGFSQELGAERAVLALRESLVSLATVTREGVERAIPAADLVPGDLVRVREGDRVPADARLVEEIGLEVDESLLTGESLPVPKHPDPVGAESPLAERTSMLFSGTAVTRGLGRALVVATGAATEQGLIAELTDRAKAPPTPLQRRLGALAAWMVVLGAVVTVALAGAMLARGEPLREAFLVGVSVAVAAVPEGLSATVTIALALGAREMAQRGAVVSELAAIETIGEATVVCADKTGTLTQNRLRVEGLEPSSGRSDADLLAGALASSHALIDPVDRALVEAARDHGLDEEVVVVRSLPFEASRKRATVLVSRGGALRAVMKGAPEVVLGRSVGDPAEIARLGEQALAWAAEGVRVLALAERPIEHADVADEELEHALEPLGLVALADPLRPAAAGALQEARELDLDVQMLTGDHELTARAIAGQLGLPDDAVHARVTPADKLRLVTELQRGGHVVAVTGDGINDAPALRQADVGIAMGLSGTEAAREASALVLTDDDFATIVAAVREGRRITGNLRSFLAFLLSANLGEVVLFGIAVTAGLGAPMTVVQILVVNLLTDGPPAIALARDPAGAGAARLERVLFPRRLLAALGAIGLVVGVAALAAFLAVRELRPEAAQTAAFATVALAELAFVWSCRSERLPTWRLPPNRFLRVAVVASLAVVAVAVYVPALHAPLGTVSLRASELAIVLGLAAVPALVAETVKRARRSSRDGVRGDG